MHVKAITLFLCTVHVVGGIRFNLDARGVRACSSDSAEARRDKHSRVIVLPGVAAQRENKINRENNNVTWVCNIPRYLKGLALLVHCTNKSSRTYVHRCILCYIYQRCTVYMKHLLLLLTPHAPYTLYMYT